MNLPKQTNKASFLLSRDNLAAVDLSSLACLQAIHARGSFELQVSQVLYDERVVDRLAVLSCELELETTRRGVRAQLAGVAAADDVV